ncbi:MAG: ABC transporter ATP-binding protein [Planctomycetes bacterium]|nr:ABC transporter ATP-binding protein [Planctomycetota bacterium]
MDVMEDTKLPSPAQPTRGTGSKLDGLIAEEVLEQGAWKVFWRFVPYLWPLKDKVVLTLLMTFVGVPLSQISVFMGRYLVDDVILNTEESVSWRMWMFFVIVSVQALMWMNSQVMWFVSRVMHFAIDINITWRIRKMFYSHLHKLSLNFFRTRPIGEHMYRTGEAGGLLPLIHYDLPQLVDIIYRIIWGAILVSMVDWRITVLVLIYIVPYTFMAHKAYSYVQKVNAESRIQGQRATAVLRDSVAGVKTVKGYGRTAFQARKYGARLSDLRRIWIKSFFISVITHHFVLWGYRLIVGKIKWIYIGYQTMVGNLSIGEFSVMFWLIGQLEAPMERIVNHFQNIRIHLVPAMRVLETLDVPPEIQDAPEAAVMPPIRGKVEFKDVSFEYVKGKRVIEHVDITLEPGTFAAFVGPSGAGKSTVLYLLLRLFEAQEGQVLIDGVDIKKVKLRTALDQVGVVLQETLLFGGTVADNVRYGNLRATDEQMWEAIRRAELEGFVARLPQGITTHLGEGTKLSGGERQRIGLARALIRDPKILILDEPTAFLDSRTEHAIMDTFERAMRGRTTLMVSHRLVPVRHADVIFVFDQGRLVERGKHDELLALGGLYRKMWDEQTKLSGLEHFAAS